MFSLWRGDQVHASIAECRLQRGHQPVRRPDFLPLAPTPSRRQRNPDFQIARRDATNEIRQLIKKPRPARRRSKHDERSLRPADEIGGTVERCDARDRDVDRMRFNKGDLRRFRRPHVLRKFEMNRPRPFLLCEPNASRTIVGMVAGLTIWRASWTVLKTWRVRRRF